VSIGPERPPRFSGGGKPKNAHRNTTNAQIGAAQRAKLLPMANLNERLPENAPGRYYVDGTCIDCDQCRVSAPAFFGRGNETSLSYVLRQPVTPEEIALVEEVIGACATDSIGSDGT